METIVTSRSNHPALFFNTRILGRSNQRRKFFRFETKWALEHGGEPTIRFAWQREASSYNCWANLNAKLLFCNRELLKYDAKKKKLSKNELDDKITLMKNLQLHSPPNIGAIKILKMEIYLNKKM